MAKEIASAGVNAEKIDYNQIKQWLLNIVGKKPCERRLLIMECIKNFKLSKEEMKNTSSDSALTKSKSKVGSVLSKLIVDGDVIVDENKTIKLEKKIVEINTKDEIETFIVEQIKSGSLKTKKAVFALCDEKFTPKSVKTDLLSSAKNKKSDDLKDSQKAINDEVIHTIAGNILDKLVKTEIIVKGEQGKYSIAKTAEFPNTEIGNCLKDAAASQDIYSYFIKILNIKGGEFFEEFSVKLIENVLAISSKIVSSKVTGGTNDNGIDGIIVNIDELGYQETIFIQCKVRASGAVTLKELREFFGALNAEKGTRGLFITNSTFHSEATKFINKQRNLIGIDGKKLFELAKKVKYGVLLVDKHFVIDKTIFLDNTTIVNQ